jgi:curli production assembly/transport component CsgG
MPMRSIMRVLLASMLSVLSLTALAKTVEVSQKATGFGDSPDAAVTNALVEASRQSLGVSVLLDPNFRSETFEWVATENLAAGGSSSKPEAQAKTLANVAGYTVLSTKEVKEKLWQAEVEVRLLKPASIGPDKSNLPSIVVAPVRAYDSSYDIGEEVSGRDVASNLHRQLVISLTQGGRFRVLDRQYPKEVNAELANAAAGLSPFEHAKLGQKLGADLVLTTDVEKFQLGREGNTFYGAKLQSTEPFIRIHYQLINVASSEIISAGTWKDQQSQNEFRARLRDDGIELGREPDRVGEVLYPYVARQLSGEVVDVLYPMRVLSASAANAIYVTQGAGRVEAGDLLSVHLPQKEVIDPDSGIALRLESDSVATLRVTSLGTGYALTELLTGELSSVTASALLRHEASPMALDEKTGKPMTPGSSEAPIKW